MKFVMYWLMALCLFSGVLKAANEEYLNISGLRWSFDGKSEKVYLGFSTRPTRKLNKSERELLLRSHLLFLVTDLAAKPLGYLIVAAEYDLYSSKGKLAYQYTVTKFPRSARRLYVLGMTDVITASYHSGDLEDLDYDWVKMTVGHISGVISASSNWKPGQQYAKYAPVKSLFVPFRDSTGEVKSEKVLKMEAYLNDLGLSWDKLFVKNPNQTDEEVEEKPKENPKRQKKKYRVNEEYDGEEVREVRMRQPNGLKEGTCGVVYASKMSTRRCNRNVCVGFLNE